MRLIAPHLHLHAQRLAVALHYHFAALLITLQPKAQILLCLRLWGRVVLGILAGGAGLDGLLGQALPSSSPAQQGLQSHGIF